MVCSVRVAFGRLSIFICVGLFSASAYGQLINFKQHKFQKWNLGLSTFTSQITYSNSDKDSSSSLLYQLAAGYGVRLAESTDMHFNLKYSFGSSKVYNFDEHIMFNLDPKNSVPVFYKFGLGFHYLGYEPETDRPGFRNLGGVGLCAQIEGKDFGGAFEYSLYRNSASDGFAKMLELSVYYNLLHIDYRRSISLLGKYFDMDYRSHDSGEDINFKGIRLGLIYDI